MGLLEKILNNQIQNDQKTEKIDSGSLIKKAENILSGSKTPEPDKKKNRDN